MLTVVLLLLVSFVLVVSVLVFVLVFVAPKAKAVTMLCLAEALGFCEAWVTPCILS